MRNGGIDTMRVLKDRLMVFIIPQHELRHQEEVDWTLLQGERIVALTRDSGIRLLTEMGFEQAGVTFRPSLEVHQISTAL